ncbi:hypothetical protein ID852_11155 [Xenorhabdus sp. 42]|nr:MULTISPECIES: hypothetical protein [unclassified Xenorhabdus]MBD2821234.1 hypothetical protein [Xenorhabdus sp. 42]MBD2825570.1 hypothetical protein [Xenorhabdus sp. 5]
MRVSMSGVMAMQLSGIRIQEKVVQWGISMEQEERKILTSWGYLPALD